MSGFLFLLSSHCWLFSQTNKKFKIFIDYLTKIRIISLRYEAIYGSLAQSVEQRTFNPLVEGSNPSRPTILSVNHLSYLSGSLAQSVEQRTFNPLVEGSNPSRPTT